MNTHWIVNDQLAWLVGIIVELMHIDGLGAREATVIVMSKYNLPFSNGGTYVVLMARCTYLLVWTGIKPTKEVKKDGSRRRGQACLPASNNLYENLIQKNSVKNRAEVDERRQYVIKPFWFMSFMVK